MLRVNTSSTFEHIINGFLSFLENCFLVFSALPHSPDGGIEAGMDLCLDETGRRLNGWV